MVVVLPFVPVIIIKGVLVFKYAYSISEMTGIFNFFNFWKIGALGGIPGLVIAYLEPWINSSVCPPVSIWIL